MSKATFWDKRTDIFRGYESDFTCWEALENTNCQLCEALKKENFLFLSHRVGKNILTNLDDF